MGQVRGQENGTSHLCVYALSSQGLMTSMREESIPSRAISESRQNRDTRCSRWVPDFCQRWGKSIGVINSSGRQLRNRLHEVSFILKPLFDPVLKVTDNTGALRSTCHYNQPPTDGAITQ